MNKRLCYGSAHIIFLSLFLVQLTYLPTNSFLLTDKDGHVTDLVNIINHGPSTFSIPKIMAKSDAGSIGLHNPIIDEVDPDNLEKTVFDLAPAYTRHTESELIDDVASWLAEKLQSICGRGVYVHNFTHIPEKDNVDSQHQEIPSYRLKNIVCEKPSSTNKTIL
jgi:hypothetical protein